MEDVFILKLGYSCHICEETFISQLQLSEHLQYHKFHQCYICADQYPTLRKLLNHFEETHTKKLACPYCKDSSEKFASVSKVTLHIREEHSQQKCDECQMTFSGQKAFNNHKLLMHDHAAAATATETETATADILCHQCGKRFKKKEYLKRHEATHRTREDIEKNGKECPICHKKFSSCERLRSHKMGVHQKTPHKCDECGKTINGESSFRAHKKIHAGIKPHVCTICGWKFVLKRSLRFHILTHTGEKPITCKICERKFTQHSGLYIHMKKMHPNQNVN